MVSKFLGKLLKSIGKLYLFGKRMILIVSGNIN